MKKHKFFAVFTAALLAFTVFGCKQNDDNNPEKCTLTYDSNGGSGEMKSVTGDEGSEITLTAYALKKNGYTFSEWNTKADGSGDKYADKEKIKLTANTTLYAQWTANKYTVKFDSNGGSDDALTEIKATYDVEFELPENNFTKIGYTFAGWNTKEDGSGTDYKAKSNVKNLTDENGATVTLYAKWTERGTHNIVYELNGGSHIDTQKEQFKETDEVTLGTAERTGYTFGGWYEAENFNGTAIESWNAGEKTADVTLYAKWTANTYTVKFDANGEYATGTMTEQTFTYGTSQALNENKFTRTGYNFAGWATSADGKVAYNDKQDYSIGTEDVTLYAKWTAIVYSITYELDGGANAEGNPANYIIEDSIILKAPTRDGFTFVCWYSDRSKKTEIAKGSTGDIVLQAVWKDNADFVKVPAVSITGSESWTPESEVFVSGRTLDIKAFWMSDHEVTRAEWKDVMGSAPSNMAKAYDKDGNELTGNDADNNPVNLVSWYDAIVYCNKRSINEKLTPCYTINGSTDPDKWGDVPILPREDTWKDSVTCDFTANGYRLPTEAEWEWAARGGENYKYAGSDNINEVAWYTEKTNDTGTREVKTLKTNGYGLYDMSGNVSEWCWDWYDSISSSTHEAGASSGYNRVERGGSCYRPANICEAAYRLNNYPVDRGRGTGFRVVRTAED